MSQTPMPKPNVVLGSWRLDGVMSHVICLIQDVETILYSTTANRPPREKVLKKTMIRIKGYTTIQILSKTTQW